MTAAQVEKSFWLKWVGAVVGGAAAGYLAVTVMLEFARGPEALGVPFELSFPITLGLIGAVVGLLQALLLRRHGVGVIGWVLATTIGFTAGYVVIFNYLPAGNGVRQAVLMDALRGAVIGMTTGVAQGLVLRRLYRMPGWLVASIVGWAAAGAVRDLTGGAEGGPLNSLMGFAIAATVTGAAMAQLLRHPLRR